MMLRGEPVVEASKIRLVGSSPLRVLMPIPRLAPNSCRGYQHLVDKLGIAPSPCAERPFATFGREGGCPWDPGRGGLQEVSNSAS